MFYSGILSVLLGPIVLLLIFIWRRKIGLRENGLPPGPTTIPLLGNIHQLPTRYPHVKYTSWARRYGKIFSLKIAHGTAIVITSPSIIRDFMDKRSSSTAHRPPMKIVDLVTDGCHPALTDGPVWKNMRKAMQLFLTREACARHLTVQRAECIQLMYDTLKQPEGLLVHIKRQTISIILSTVFGVRSPRFENSIASQFVEGNSLWERILEPGATPPLDLLPILQYIPEFLAPWKAGCREIRNRQQNLYFGLRDMCAKRMKDGRRNGCFLEDIIDLQEKWGIDSATVGYIGGGCLEGGSGNTSSFLQTAMLLLACHPHVQEKAQKELDDVIGKDRLPSSEDYEKLPYVRAIIRETFRFFPPVPLGLPHSSTTDETVEGFYIPKGSIIFMNYYGIYHDPDLFDLPERFIPERFLTSEFGTKQGVDATGLRHDLHFGSGRRICPGIVFAMQSIEMNIMSLLWAFNLKIATDTPRDAEIPIQFNDFTPGIASGPKPFACDVHPRSQAHADIIRAEYAQARSVFSMFEQELTPDERAFVSEW